MKNSSKLLSALLLLIGLAYILSPLVSFAKDKHKEYEYEHEDEHGDDDDRYEYSAPQLIPEATPAQQTSALDHIQQQLTEQYAALEARRRQLEQQRTQQQQIAEQLASAEKQLNEQRTALETKAQQLAQRKSQQDIAAKQLKQEEQQLNNEERSPISSAIKTGMRKVATIFTGSNANTAMAGAAHNNVIAVKDENRNGISDILEGFLRIARR